MEPKFLSMIEKTIIIFSSRNGYIKKREFPCVFKRD